MGTLLIGGQTQVRHRVGVRGLGPAQLGYQLFTALVEEGVINTETNHLIRASNSAL